MNWLKRLWYGFFLGPKTERMVLEAVTKRLWKENGPAWRQGRGWAYTSPYDPTRPRIRYTLMSAIIIDVYNLYLPSVVGQRIVQRLEGHLGVRDLAAWHNAPGRTIDDVIQLLHQVQNKE